MVLNYNHAYIKHNTGKRAWILVGKTSVLGNEPAAFSINSNLQSGFNLTPTWNGQILVGDTLNFVGGSRTLQVNLEDSVVSHNTSVS